MPSICEAWNTVAGKLIPHWLQALAELTASQIENLNRAERLGVIEDVERWLELRRLCNRLVHEYLEQPNDFAEGLRVARDDSPMLLDAYHRIREYAEQRMSIETDRLPIPASLAPLTGSRRALSSQI